MGRFRVRGPRVFLVFGLFRALQKSSIAGPSVRL